VLSGGRSVRTVLTHSLTLTLTLTNTRIPSIPTSLCAGNIRPMPNTSLLGRPPNLAIPIAPNIDPVLPQLLNITEPSVDAHSHTHSHTHTHTHLTMTGEVVKLEKPFDLDTNQEAQATSQSCGLTQCAHAAFVVLLMESPVLLLITMFPIKFLPTPRCRIRCPIVRSCSHGGTTQQLSIVSALGSMLLLLVVLPNPEFTPSSSLDPTHSSLSLGDVVHHSGNVRMINTGRHRSNMSVTILPIAWQGRVFERFQGGTPTY